MKESCAFYKRGQTVSQGTEGFLEFLRCVGLDSLNETLVWVDNREFAKTTLSSTALYRNRSLYDRGKNALGQQITVKKTDR